MSETIIDFQIINKHYTSKWNLIYKSALKLPCDIVEKDIQI
jgi:hypothetical protein